MTRATRTITFQLCLIQLRRHNSGKLISKAGLSYSFTDSSCTIQVEWEKQQIAVWYYLQLRVISNCVFPSILINFCCHCRFLEIKKCQTLCVCMFWSHVFVYIVSKTLLVFYVGNCNKKRKERVIILVCCSERAQRPSCADLISWYNGSVIVLLGVWGVHSLSGRFAYWLVRICLWLWGGF